MIKNINITDAEVSAELHGYMYLALYDYQGILHAGSRMTAEIVSNNEIKINDGILCNYGRFMRIVGSETVRIENGSSGVKRTDLIVARFTTTETKETHTLTVIKGPAGGAEPSYNQTDIYSGTGTRDLVLYAVHLNGLNIVSVERKCQEYMSIRELTETVSKNVWSDWISCGTNACGITLKYRYNDGLKLVELNWDGVVNAPIGGNTMGYMWTGFPADKKPKGNMFIPVPNPAADAGLVIRYYPLTNDMTKGNFTLTSLRNTINDVYICGFYTYSYA
ncbi:hypothetical protein [Catenibacterium sp.]|uniref:hypothetical protein n=1 Tax=Catenibacterium sp. TaxID=2049022 RepID=UPI003AB16B37